MKETFLSEGFWKEVSDIQKSPVELRKSQFMDVVSACAASKKHFFLILFTAVVLGGKEGDQWFREAIPMLERVNGNEKIKQLQISKEIKIFMERVLLEAPSITNDIC